MNHRTLTMTNLLNLTHTTKALGEVWPTTRVQRCWVHKTAACTKTNRAALHQAPFDQVRMQRFSRSPTKPLTWLDCYRRCVNWDCRIGQIHQTRAARISMRLIG